MTPQKLWQPMETLPDDGGIHNNMPAKITVLAITEDGRVMQMPPWMLRDQSRTPDHLRFPAVAWMQVPALAAAFPDLPEIEGMLERVRMLTEERDLWERRHDAVQARVSNAEGEAFAARMDQIAAESSARRAGMEEGVQATASVMRSLAASLARDRGSEHIARAIRALPLPATSPQEEGWKPIETGDWVTAACGFPDYSKPPLVAITSGGEDGRMLPFYISADAAETLIERLRLVVAAVKAYRPPPPAQPTTGEPSPEDLEAFSRMTAEELLAGLEGLLPKAPDAPR